MITIFFYTTNYNALEQQTSIKLPFAELSPEEREAAFVRLLEENKARIMRLASVYTRTRADREDVFQDIAIQLWRALPSFRGEAQTSTWVYRIALNVAMRSGERLQHTARRHVPMSDTAASWFDAGSEYAQEPPAIEHLRHCMRKLPERQRTVVMLTLEECEYREIATVTGLTESNVGVILSRVKKHLLNCINTLMQTTQPRTEART
jgi:RNA polymerase sigma-70 factor (ECF subfamily)